MEIRSKYDPTLFEGTAFYYARFRPLYPSALFEHLAHCYRLDGTGVALDLGCGTGQLSIPIAGYFSEVIGMDPDPDMLREARRLATESDVTNIEFVSGSSWDLSTKMGPFRLITMADSFHWMDRDSVLEVLYEIVSSGGGVAVVSREIETPESYQTVLNQMLTQFLGHQRRAGHGYDCHPQDRHEVVLGRSRFTMIQPWSHTYEEEWDVSRIIGFLYSTSYASRRLLGEKSDDFEREFRKLLLTLEPSGNFLFRTRLTALLAMKR